jgi:hypothetical protein
MKAGLRKVVLEVCVRVGVIVARRGGLEELSSEQASITKAKTQSFIQLVFSDQIEFVADMTARAGTCGNSNSSTAGVEVVI